MGFLTSASTVTITAKLTPFGRQQLLTNNSNIITTFSLGDSDANYFGDLSLGIGEVPSLAGEIGANNLFSNGVYSGVAIKSPIVVNALGETKKQVAAGSTSVIITPTVLGITGITSDSLIQLITDRTDGNNDSYSNLFKSFGLPITTNEKLNYSSILSSSNGYLDTAIRELNQDKVLVIAIDKCSYGETLDGKTIRVEITTTADTFTLFSTFQKSLTPLTSVDNQVKELLNLGAVVNNNIAFLFSDDIQPPNNNPALSWATGFGTSRPFSLNGKQLFNSVNVSSTNQNVDTAVGVAYLDKGFIVITNPSIVNNFDTVASSGATVVTYNHISNEVAQNITCIVERDEFASTNNSTWNEGDLIRVSEIALYDNFNNVIAYAKSNEHILIGASQYVALGVRILV